MIEFYLQYKEYLLHIGIMVCMYSILVQGFNISFGCSRLLNLAHVGVYAVGAYATALLSTTAGLDLSFFEIVLCSALISGLLALLVGGISLRLSDEYFVIGSLAFSFVISALLINWRELTGGVLGIPGIPRPRLWGIDFSSAQNFFMLTAALTLVCQVLLYVTMRSSFARSLRALAEYEAAATSLGRDARFLKTISFFVASLFAGVAGSLFSYFYSYIDPSSFGLHEMVFVLTIAVVGRPGSFWGVLVATVFLVAVLPESLRFLELPPGSLGPLRQMIHGVILFAVVCWFRERIFPMQRSI